MVLIYVCKLYFFPDYKSALKEFTMVAGKIPLPPRHAFGIFYSRYWAYNDIGQMVWSKPSTVVKYHLQDRITIMSQQNT